MPGSAFDYMSKDPQATPVTAVEPSAFDLERYAACVAECDLRYAEFLSQPEGIAVWQRVRAGAVFRDACRDMRDSLRLQLGALESSTAYASDAPSYLEPWYGIGTTIAHFGGMYEWLEGQAPVVRPLYSSLAGAPPLAPRHEHDVPILRYTLETIEYFLNQTQGRVPLSWCDLQAPVNVATQLVDTSAFLLGMVDWPERTGEILAAITGAVISFTRTQSALIGSALARPGHGFASAYTGTGIGLSTDNLVMVSPRMFERFCVPGCIRIGEAFGGLAIHSCGNWTRWLSSVRRISNLTMVDAAFGPRTDPDPCDPESFRDALANTGVVLQARIVGDPEEVLDVARRLWAPGMRLIFVTYLQDPQTQHKLYRDLHLLCQ